jgi:ubiquinone/menaquinone biosynthesis C-methylase UbiE
MSSDISSAEMQRLIFQAAVLRPLTERLMRNAGIRPGMRVLDLGCGAGDVTMLVAEVVGVSGNVIGIDRSPEAIALAQKRVGDTPHDNITFAQCAVEDYAGTASFDAVSLDSSVSIGIKSSVAIPIWASCGKRLRMPSASQV